MQPGLMRIGELSRESGVSPEVLRAWERRYGLLEPERTGGGFRMYSATDLARVRAMSALVESGVPASEGARRILSAGAPASGAAPSPPLDGLRSDLRRALRSFDDAGTQEVFDRLLARFDIETLIVEVLVPELRALGDEWSTGEATVGQEHFAANLLRARLLALGRGWDRGVGPRLVLACGESELHDISLAMFGLLAHARGWRITFLGANTPAETLVAAARTVAADAVVIFAMFEEALRPTIAQLSAFAPAAVYFAGRGSGAVSEAFRLGDDLVEAADHISNDWRQRRRTSR